MEYAELIDVLSSLRPGTDFEKEEDLLGKKILTSFDIMMLAAQLADEFDVELDAADILPEHFYSAKTLFALIESKQDR